MEVHENIAQSSTPQDGKFDDSENVTSEILLKILAEEGNDICFDCGTDSNQWASVNNGVLLCYKCSEVHKKLGVDISIIKSTTVDKWEPFELNYLQIGGNKRLQQYFEKYDLKRELAIATKYKTRAAFFYREELRSMVENGPHYLEIDEKEAIDIIDSQIWENYKKEALVSAKNQNNDIHQTNTSKIFGYLGTALSKTTQVTKNAVHKLNEKIHDPNLQENLMKFGNSVAVKTASLGHQTVEMTKKGMDTVKNAAISVNEKVHDPSVQQGVKQLGNTVLSKSKDIGKSSVEIGKKGIETVKSGIMGTFNFFKKSAGMEAEKDIAYEEAEEEKKQGPEAKGLGLNSKMMDNEMKH